MRSTASKSGRRPVVVITGASAGIGRASAVAFARRGYDVALLARGAEGLAGARQEVEAAGGSALTIQTDVADADAVFAAAQAVWDRFGRMDVWVNNAMVTTIGPVEAIPPGEYRRVTEVSYLGTVHGTLAALKHMRPRDRGMIVQIGSALAYRSIPLQSAYCGAKAAIRGFTDSLRTELIHDGSAIRLTMVQLPGVNTPQFGWSKVHTETRHQPVGAIFQPEAVAEVIVDAAERAPRELWVGLPALEAIMGAFVAPALSDHVLARSAYEDQLSSTPASSGPQGILSSPADRDHGARGPFSARSKDRVTSFDPQLLRAGAGLALAGALGAAFLVGSLVARRPGLRLLPRF